MQEKEKVVTLNKTLIDLQKIFGSDDNMDDDNDE